MSKIALNGMKDIIETALREKLVKVHLDHVELREGLDHVGDAAVFVTAVLSENAPIVPGDISLAASVAVAHAIEDAGDDRLSYLSLRYPDDIRPID